MGGADKAALEYAGRSLLERALAATSAATRTVVVGPEQPTGRPVTFVREDPPLGGPAAGLLAGRDALAAIPEPAPGLVVVLAVDMPLVRPGTVARLVRAAAGRQGAFLADADGRRQLAGCLSVAALDAARPERGTDTGLPLHRLLAGLDLATVEAEAEEARDVDTWDDYAELPT
jgi:molybdopterin-guanine dinucleotide biosynthesis protein A